MTPTPGWYPDPSGDAGRYRWWDGDGWTDVVGASVDRRPSASTGIRSRPAPAARSVSTTLVVGLALAICMGICAGWLVWREPRPPVRIPSAGSRVASPVGQPQGELTESDRRASIGSASMVLPSTPYQVSGDPVRVAAVLDVLFMAHAPVHQHYDGSRTWSAMVGFAALDQGLGADDDLHAVASRTLQRLAHTLFVGQTTSLAGVSTADHAVDGRPGVLLAGRVTYTIPGLSSRYDQATALVIRLDDGTAVAAVAFVPNDAPDDVHRLAAAAVATLSVS